MHSPKRIKVTEVNPHLICVLCRGYYIDATTIIECLHSFCKTCIVKYLQSNKYCPICDVQVHKTSPLLNIRSDKTLQNIVYKLVPSLFKNEMERRVEFYRQHPEHLPSIPEERGEVGDHSPIFLPDEVLVLCLEYLCDKPPAELMPKRFIHCPAEMTLGHLIKLIRGKFNLLPAHQVNILFKDDLLPEYLTVMEVAYTYQCRRKTPIHLYYRILELKKTTIRLLEVKERKEEAAPLVTSDQVEKEVEQRVKAEKRPAVSSSEGTVVEKSLIVEKVPVVERSSQHGEKIENEWKEVQLQISENGVMSVRNMKNSECSPKPAVEAPPTSSQTNSQPVAQLTANVTPVTHTISTSSSMISSAHVTKPTTSNGPLVSLPSELTTSIIPSNYTASPRIPSTKPILSVSKVTKDQVKKDFNNVEANKLSISRVPAMGFKEKSEALNKIVSKLSPNERVIGNTSVTIRPVLSTPSIKTYQPVPQTPHVTQPTSKVQKPERKQQQTVRYKTLSSPTKQWNPSIDRTTMLTMKQNYDMSKPPRFFKMRNMPRYLGNPASGVKPMFGTSNEEAPKDPKPRSPTKLPPPFTPGSPKAGKSPYPEKTSWTPRVPSPAHSGSLYNANPYLLYSGFPGSFTPDPSILANANPDLVRSMFANSAYHPSLPPSINMLFNPLHNVPRPTLESPSSVQRVLRSKSPPKIDEKLDKPVPNLIPANIPTSHTLVSRSPTLPPSTLGIPPGPSIPPHPSHPPGSLLPPSSSAIPPRLPLSISSPIHHHNPLLHQNPPLHSSLMRPLGSPRVPSPVGSPRTSSPLHTSPPKQLSNSSGKSSPKPKSDAQQKPSSKTEAQTELKTFAPQIVPSSSAPTTVPSSAPSHSAPESSITCTSSIPTSAPPGGMSASPSPVQNSQPPVAPEEVNQSSETTPAPKRAANTKSEKCSKDTAANNNNNKEKDVAAPNAPLIAPTVPNDK